VREINYRNIDFLHFSYVKIHDQGSYRFAQKTTVAAATLHYAFAQKTTVAAAIANYNRYLPVNGFCHKFSCF